jgi:hypothetical protein
MIPFGSESFVFLSPNQNLEIKNNFTCCFYGCGTWSLTVREGYRSRVLGNRENIWFEEEKVT